jgi:hypothetical protein
MRLPLRLYYVLHSHCPYRKQVKRNQQGELGLQQQKVI